MSAEYAGKRQRVGEAVAITTAAAAINLPTSTTSSVDLASMLKQALGRIESLERQHKEMKTSTGRETTALWEDICRLKQENKAILESTGRETNALRRETKALRDDIEALKSDKKALEWFNLWEDICRLKQENKAILESTGRETNALRRETKALRDDIEALRSDKKA
ncbi:hypothetical protein THAOC_02354, partial [Thalassiosira oceanica]